MNLAAPRANGLGPRAPPRAMRRGSLEATEPLWGEA